MLSTSRKSLPSTYRFDATALSGFVTEPFKKDIPTLAPSLLPQAGGFATARSGAFNLDEVVSVSSAYTLVTARTESEDRLVALTTAVVEDLNILEVVTARRIVAQLLVTYSKAGKADKGATGRTISLAGSRFEGLRIAGHEHSCKLNLTPLPRPGTTTGSELALPWDDLAKATQNQLAGETRDFDKWPIERQIIDIPGYGKIFLGELDVTPESVRFVSIRVELGCLVAGQVVGPQPNASGGSGVGGDK
jgi:hypothetical protein